MGTTLEWFPDELVLNYLTYNKYPESVKPELERDKVEFYLETELNNRFQDEEMQAFRDAIKDITNYVFTQAFRYNR